MSRRRMVGFLLVALMLLPLTVAGAQGANQQTAQHTLVIAIPGEVPTLDPDFSRYPISNMVLLNIYEQWFQYGSKPVPGESYTRSDISQIKGAAIESWQISPDRLTLTLNVRQGVTFPTTGDEMTADDFLYWLNKGPATKSGILWNENMAGMKSWEKTGKYQFQIHFSKPIPSMFWMLGRDQAWGVVDSKAAMAHATSSDPWGSQWLAKHYAGNGEYKIASWDPGSTMVLEAHTNGYWRQPPYFTKVILRVVPSGSTRALLLQKGDVDIALSLSQQEEDQLRGTKGVRILTVPSRSRNLVFLNCSKPPFNNVTVRQALSYLVPYQQIVNDFYQGRAQPMKSPIPSLSPWSDSSAWTYTYDVAKAKQLLAEAGFPNGLQYTLNVMSGDTTATRLGVLLQQAARPAGVTVNVHQVTSAVLAEQESTGTAEATLRTEWLNYIDDPYYFLGGYYTGSATNRSHYSNPTIDKIHTELATTFDDATRHQLADEFQKILIQDAPQLWLASTPLTYAMRSDIGGFKVLEDSLIWFYPLDRQN